MVKCNSKIKNHQLLIKVKLAKDEQLNEIDMTMFSRKNVNCLFNIKKFSKNRVELIGPEGEPLINCLKEPITKYHFYSILEQLAVFSKELNMNRLSIARVMLDLNYVYYNIRTQELRFIYLPLVKMNESTNMFEFVRTIVNMAKPVKGKDANYVSRAMKFISNITQYDPNQLEQYVMKDLRDFNLNELDNDLDENTMKFGEKDKVVEEYNSEIDDETGLLTIQDDETTGFLQYPTNYVDETKTNIVFPKLRRISTNEVININKPVFRIGKEKNTADYYVDNNSAVSRNHLDIVVRGNRYFVIDLHSMNRTYINESIIPIRQETEIYDGDRLKLANEEFIFFVSE